MISDLAAKGLTFYGCVSRPKRKTRSFNSFFTAVLYSVSRVRKRVLYIMPEMDTRWSRARRA